MWRKGPFGNFFTCRNEVLNSKCINPSSIWSAFGRHLVRLRMKPPGTFAPSESWEATWETRRRIKGLRVISKHANRR